jgi:hypothetical protein
MRIIAKRQEFFNGPAIWDEFIDSDPDTSYLENKPLVFV